MRRCVLRGAIVLGVLALRASPAGAFQCSGGRSGSCTFVSVPPVSPTTMRVTVSDSFPDPGDLTDCRTCECMIQ